MTTHTPPQADRSQAASERDSQPASTLRDEAELRYHGARPRWQLINLQEIWKHRELLWIVATRDLKVRYRQTLVGIAWVLFQPLTTATVFLVLFSLLGTEPTVGELPYALVVLSGLLPWQLFAATLTQAGGSLVANQYLIGKVYFPRLILPLATALPALVDFAIGLLVLVAAMAYYGVLPSWHVVFLPLFVALAVLAALAGGIFLSALNAVYRDAGIVAAYLVQVGFFVSPVVYATAALIPPGWQPVLALNPMVGAIEGVRWSLFETGSPPALSLLLAATIVGLGLLAALAYFRRVERYVADRI